MRPSFTIAAILAAVAFTADAELGRRSYRPNSSSIRPQQRRTKYPVRTPPRSYGATNSRSYISPTKSYGRLANKGRSYTARKANPTTKSYSRSRPQKYGSRYNRNSRPAHMRSAPTRQRPSTKSYQARPRPQSTYRPQPTKKPTPPNYATKKVDLHKLVEQVEINTLLTKSLQMKVNELEEDKAAL